MKHQGNLTIGKDSNPNDYQHITEITGDLDIIQTDMYLKNLRFIEGDLNTRFKTCVWIPAIEETGGNVDIRAKVFSRSLVVVGGYFKVHTDRTLGNTQTFSNVAESLEVVGDHIVIPHGIQLPALRGVGGFTMQTSRAQKDNLKWVASHALKPNALCGHDEHQSGKNSNGSKTIYAWYQHLCTGNVDTRSCLAFATAGLGIEATYYFQENQNTVRDFLSRY